MDDLISRQAAIEAIEEYADRLQMVNWQDNPSVPYKAYALNWCINKIRELPSAQPEPRWIPCSERLPEKDQICIVTDETRSNTYEYRFCNQTYDEEQGWTYLKHRIIAWMPLPEPYKEETE